MPRRQTGRGFDQKWDLSQVPTRPPAGGPPLGKHALDLLLVGESMRMLRIYKRRWG